MKKHIEVILFDLNETLIHQMRTGQSHIACTYAAVSLHQREITFEAFLQAWKEVYQDQSIKITQGIELLKEGKVEKAKNMFREHEAHQNIKSILAQLRFPLSNRLVEKITWAYQDSWVNGLKILEDTQSILEQLLNDYRLGIVTNFQQPNLIPDILNEFGLKELFETVIISAEVGYRKPHPFIFQQALDELAIDDPDSVVYVGDNIRDDIEGARFAGLNSILIDINGKHPEVDLCIEKLEALPDILSKI